MFGENSKAAIMTQLNEQGISFTPGEFRVEKFCIAVREFFGAWSDHIFMKIIADICSGSNVSLDDLGIASRVKYRSYSELLIEVFLKLEASQHDGTTKP
jgi:hypothetical protein